jgi:hypothetical protein
MVPVVEMVPELTACAPATPLGAKLKVPPVFVREYPKALELWSISKQMEPVAEL